MLGGPTALARAASGSTPAYLLRSSYLPLAGEQFRIGGKLLQLGVVDDLAGAAEDEHLRGHAEAFALTFYGPPNALGAAVQTFTHPAIGTYSLFIAAVGPVDGKVQRYEVVVDRSVGRPPDPPAPARDMSAPPAHPGNPEAGEQARAELSQELAVNARKIQRRINRRRRRRRTLLKHRRAARSRSAAAKRRAQLKRRAQRGGYTAVRRGAATLLG